MQTVSKKMISKMITTINLARSTSLLTRCRMTTVATELTSKTSLSKTTEKPVIAINPNYRNRNPKNLEWSGHQMKRFGWNLQFPPKDFYNQCFYKEYKSHVETYVQHSSGAVLVEASTRDPVIGQHLHRPYDLCGIINLGKVLADRCKQYGITHMKYCKSKIFNHKEKQFYDILRANGVTLDEAPFQENVKTVPGLNYDEKDFFTDRRRVPFPPDVNAIRQRTVDRVLAANADKQVNYVESQEEKKV